MERLQKVMAQAGIASRRKSEEYIKQKRVKVNGQIVTRLGAKVSKEDKIEVDGQIISQEKKVYLLLHKPLNYVTTTDDPHGRPTVLDLIKDVKERVYPVGRLDYDSRGLLLLTNDGQLTYVLTHPSYLIEKTYQVEIKGYADINKLKKLATGLKLEDGLTAPAKLSSVSTKGRNTIFTLTIHEGKNRQIRRMCQKLGYFVVDLKRIRIGPLKLNNLKEGEFRFLNKSELNKLFKLKE